MAASAFAKAPVDKDGGETLALARALIARASVTPDDAGCLDLIAGQGKALVDLSRIDFKDQAVFAMIQRGDTVGTFQIESRAQIQTLLKTKPETLEDLVVQVAIVRPGPIVGGATKPWIRAREQYRLTGKPEITYDHPLLEAALEEMAITFK